MLASSTHQSDVGDQDYALLRLTNGTRRTKTRCNTNYHQTMYALLPYRCSLLEVDCRDFQAPRREKTRCGIPKSLCKGHRPACPFFVCCVLKPPAPALARLKQTDDAYLELPQPPISVPSTKLQSAPANSKTRPDKFVLKKEGFKFGRSPSLCWADKQLERLRCPL